MTKLWPLLFMLFLACALPVVSFGQQDSQKRYAMVAGNDETVRLDPGYYHTGPAYQPGWEGKKVQVDVDADKPVTLAIVSAQDWNNATQHPETLASLNFTCVQEHIVKATYTCDLPPNDPKVLVVRDDRGAFAGWGEVVSGRDYDRRDHDSRDRDRQISEGLGAVLSRQSPRQFFAPNNVHIQYYDWGCVENCNLPDPPHDRVFNWVPSNQETLRLDPADYYAGGTFVPGTQGASIQVDIQSTRPVSIGLTTADDWNHLHDAVLPKTIDNIQFFCIQQHAVKTTYVCNMPASMWNNILIIQDERGDDRGLAHRDAHAPNSISPTTLTPTAVHYASDRREFASPNEVHVQYYAWRCVAYCDQPVFQWVSQVREKYPLTNVLKLYSGITPDHDGEEVSVKVKSPVPMAVAILPSNIAGQLYGKPEMFESAVEKSSCQQRGVQSSTFQCRFNVADGPQSLVLLPEPGSDIPRKKKTEIEVQAVRCVENCSKLPAAN